MASVRSTTVAAPSPRPTTIHASDGVQVAALQQSSVAVPMAPARMEEVRAAVSPGTPHTHSFTVNGLRYTVRQPTRGMLRSIRRRVAAEVSVYGAGAVGAMSIHDGRLIEAEAYLAVCLTEAPAHWLSRDGVPAFDDLDERELGEVWAAAQPWLGQFEDGSKPAAPSVSPTPAPAGADDAGAPAAGQ